MYDVCCYYISLYIVIILVRTFISLLKLTGIDKTLLTEGHHYTVFAPTDDAFDGMETTVLEALMADKKRLKKVYSPQF